MSTGVISASLLQPFDLLKTRLQQPGPGSTVTSLQNILKSSEGIRGLWRGTLPSVCRTGVGAALYFSTLNSLRSYVAQAQATPVLPTTEPTGEEAGYQSSSLPRLSNGGNLATGAVARASVGLAMMPITIIKVRYESNLYSYKSIPGAAKAIWRVEGLQGFFTGYGATALRDAPYAGLYVLFYEQCKQKLSHIYDASDQSMQALPRVSVIQSLSINFTASAIAAGLATTITNPFDVLKTRLQLMPGKYKNVLQAANAIFRNDGMRSLFDGLGLRMSRKAVSAALTWTFYEELIKVAEGKLRSSV